jgi:hypothetical protein
VLADRIEFILSSINKMTFSIGLLQLLAMISLLGAEIENSMTRLEFEQKYLCSLPC